MTEAKRKIVFVRTIASLMVAGRSGRLVIENKNDVFGVGGLIKTYFRRCSRLVGKTHGGETCRARTMGDEAFHFIPPQSTCPTQHSFLDLSGGHLYRHFLFFVWDTGGTRKGCREVLSLVFLYLCICLCALAVFPLVSDGTMLRNLYN